MRKREAKKIAAIAVTMMLLFTSGCGGGDTDAASVFGGDSENGASMLGDSAETAVTPGGGETGEIAVTPGDGDSEEFIRRPEENSDEMYEIIEGPDGEFIKIPKNTDEPERKEQTEIMQQGDPAREETLIVYQKAMRALYGKYEFPEGALILEELSAEDMAKNSFAVCDVDSDGKDELIILYVTSEAESAKTANIYGYDADKKEMFIEMMVYPTLTFYVNGKVKAFWMYKRLSSDEVWPYTMYDYNAAKDIYEPIMYVDSWDETLHPVNYAGEAFPDEIDTDGCGMVYRLTDQSGEESVVGKSDFDEWYAGIMGREIEMMMPYLAITPENIEAITEN